MLRIIAKKVHAQWGDESWADLHGETQFELDQADYEADWRDRNEVYSIEEVWYNVATGERKEFDHKRDFGADGFTSPDHAKQAIMAELNDYITGNMTPGKRFLGDNEEDFICIELSVTKDGYAEETVWEREGPWTKLDPNPYYMAKSKKNTKAT